MYYFEYLAPVLMPEGDILFEKLIVGVKLSRPESPCYFLHNGDIGTPPAPAEIEELLLLDEELQEVEVESEILKDIIKQCYKKQFYDVCHADGLFG